MSHTAPERSPPTRAVVLTDGKAGDEMQCLGVAEALGLAPEIRRVAPRRPFAWLAPRGPLDPRERPGRPGGPLPEPWPDLVIASGRRAVPYLPALKRASNGRVFTAFLKDPRTGPKAADFVWVAEHDRLRGENVLVTLTAPHRVSPARLAAARADPDPRLSALPTPRVAVLAGGDSRHHRFTEGDQARFLADLGRLAREDGARPMITASRRTPGALRAGLARLAAQTGGFYWDGESPGENPYVALLALADAVVVTADSTNMLGEAAAAGVPVLVFSPSGGHPKFETLVRGLEARGIARSFTGRLEGARTEPLDSTPVVAAALARAYHAHRDAHGLPRTALPGLGQDTGE
ncbi:mitochondrial fission ELM1 family protein [Salinarimonas rosea]|uniref:mitochondrial fission ELM1 family protein n=1 Tax=Salinarimonas rosea TaxID=552063 RepID=UPI000423A916|nr:mitochondrial fission ELM1 family protein [Salinarimonas rosea]